MLAKDTCLACQCSAIQDGFSKSACRHIIISIDIGFNQKHLGNPLGIITAQNIPQKVTAMQLFHFQEVSPLKPGIMADH